MTNLNCTCIWYKYDPRQSASEIVAFTCALPSRWKNMQLFQPGSKQIKNISY